MSNKQHTPLDTEQPKELARVKDNIEHNVLSFLTFIGVGATFHAGDLFKYVFDRHKCAPGSASRIMRELKKGGQLDYEVVNRSESKYKLTVLNLKK